LLVSCELVWKNCGNFFIWLEWKKS